MPTFNMLEAKSNLSRLVQSVESGAETKISTTAKTADTSRRLGSLAGKFPLVTQKEFDAVNAEIAARFRGDPD